MPIRTFNKPIGGTNAALQGGGMYGSRTKFLRPDAPAQEWKTSWGGKKTVVRPLPVPDPDNPEEFLPTRSEVGEFTGWIGEFWGIANWASSIRTHFTNKPMAAATKGNEDAPKDELAGGLSLFLDPYEKDRNTLQRNNPFWVLRRKLLKACEEGREKQGWPALVLVDYHRLPEPKLLYLFQCFLFVQNDKVRFGNIGQNGEFLPPVGAREDDKVVAMILTKTAYQAMHDQMDNGEEEFQFDPVAIHPGGFIHFNQANAGSKPTTQKNIYSGKGKGGKGKQERSSYEAWITPEYEGVSASLEDQVELVRSKVHQLTDIAEFYTAEEQAHMFWDHILKFKTAIDEEDRDLYPVLLTAAEYGFAEHKEWRTDESRLAIKGAVSSSAPPAEEPFSGGPMPESPPEESPKTKAYGSKTKKSPAAEQPDPNEGQESPAVEEQKRVAKEAMDRALARRRAATPAAS